MFYFVGAMFMMMLGFVIAVGRFAVMVFIMIAQFILSFIFDLRHDWKGRR